MPTLRALREHAARVEVQYGDEKIVVYYKPHMLTPDTQKILSTASTRGGLEPLIEEFKRLVVWWDVTNDDGSMVPFDPEPLNQIGVGLIGNIINAMIQDVLNPTWASPPSQAHPTHSNNGSSQAAGWENAPTTTNSSGHLNGQESRHGSLPDSQTTEGAVSSGIPG